MQSYCLDAQGRIIKADSFTPSEFWKKTAKDQENLGIKNLYKILGLDGNPVTPGEAMILDHLKRDRQLAMDFDNPATLVKELGFNYYVGISTDPTARKYGHRGETIINEEEIPSSVPRFRQVLLTIADNFWAKMFVIYAGKPETIRNMERKLINDLRGKLSTYRQAFNKHPGGSGNLGNKPYGFVYVLID
ncbi:hypothetical protein [Desulfonema magnum]|uniref:Uncharacterized protein n=1 Tax=Desulfonema magnum TaxID=45655 RepID=A0A975GLP2_9BACT|nr:hypothetical protein [Desulfonema magnum]QTA85829.1 Uncharacterized protein dnm_018440 [Desulfonema magnum]